MVTREENERLAVLETRVANIEADVVEIKADVKALVSAVSDLRVSSDSFEQARVQRERARADTSVWVRAAIPWFIAGGALLLGLFNFFADHLFQ